MITIRVIGLGGALFLAASTKAATPAPEQDQELVSGAMVHAKKANVAAAESAIAQLNQSRINTPDWQIETAQRLIQLAVQCAGDGNSNAVLPLANRALQLANGAKDASNGSSAASAAMLAGFIYERFLADSRRALASYEAAVALLPESTSAKEAADRRKKSEETFRHGGNAK